MKKILIFAAAVILLSRVVSVSASSTKTSNNPELTVTDCLKNVANHGAYVSCVAKLHLGGTVTSQAAQSDIGKKNNENITPTTVPTGTPTVTITPTATPTEAVTPTAIPTGIVTPTATPTETVTPTETITPTVTPTVAAVTTSNQEPLGKELKRLLDKLKNLIGSFIFLPNY